MSQAPQAPQLNIDLTNTTGITNKGWARGLKKAGYATDKKYPQKLIKIIEEYKLYEFDKLREKELKKIKKETKKNYSKPEINSKKSTQEFYKVKKGDTLYSIARKFNTTVAILKNANYLKTNSLSIGQQLVVN